MYARPPIEEYPQIRSFVVSRCFYFKNFFFAFCENPSTAYFYCTVVIIASTIRAFIDCDDVHVSFADWAGGIVFEFEVTAPRVLARLASVRIRRPMHDNYPFPVRRLFCFSIGLAVFTIIRIAGDQPDCTETRYRRPKSAESQSVRSNFKSDLKSNRSEENVTRGAVFANQGR